MLWSVNGTLQARILEWGAIAFSGLKEYTALNMDDNKMWKILKEMRIPDHLTCFLGNLYAGEEATVRTDRKSVV